MDSFIPVFFAALVWVATRRRDRIRTEYRTAGRGTQVLIIGGFAVLVGLLLSGLPAS